MRNVRRAVATVAAAAAVAAATATITPAAAAGATVHGCPSGAVCIYPKDKGWNGNHPSLKYFSYGPHNLSGQVGKHYVLNNQYVDDSSGWPGVTLCKGYNATSCVPSSALDPYEKLPANGWSNTDLTPINSIYMYDR